jgi:hypothetical protein
MVKKMRIALLVVAVIGTAASMVPAAVISPGSITLTSPQRQEATRSDITVAWTWRSGSAVRSTSAVDFFVTQNGLAWYTIKVKVPVRSGSFSWNTRAWPDGVYAMRATVSGTSVKSIVSPFVIDNTAPEVRISRPAEGEVLVENERTVFFAAVVGTARLEADARDGLSGVQTVTWYLDDEQIGTGTPYDYNFSMHPGNHVLKAEAVDRAGNAATHEISIIVIPGPSAADGVVPKPSDVPIPDPTQTPSDLTPGIPSVPGAGSGDPVGSLPSPSAPQAPPAQAPQAPQGAPAQSGSGGSGLPGSGTSLTITVP